MKKTIFHR